MKVGQIAAWPKNDFGLGHGHAMAIYVALKPLISPKQTQSLKKQNDNVVLTHSHVPSLGDIPKYKG